MPPTRFSSGFLVVVASGSFLIMEHDRARSRIDVEEWTMVKVLGCE